MRTSRNSYYLLCAIFFGSGICATNFKEFLGHFGGAEPAGIGNILGAGERGRVFLCGHPSLKITYFIRRTPPRYSECQFTTVLYMR